MSAWEWVLTVLGILAATAVSFVAKQLFGRFFGKSDTPSKSISQHVKAGSNSTIVQSGRDAHVQLRREKGE